MRFPASRRAFLVVLLLFLTSPASPSFNPKWIAHQLGHELEHLAMGVASQADDSQDHEHGVNPGGDTEHRAMHAAVQFVVAPSPDLTIPSLQTTGVIRSPEAHSPIAVSIREAPFRPPRT